MTDLDSRNKYFKSNIPTYSNGSSFLGYKQPAGQFLTSWSPSTDDYANIAATTGLSGYRLRELLQSKIGTQVLNQGVSGTSSVASSYLGFPGFHQKASCQTDSDCPSGNTCYAFNEQVFGPQQGPSCSPTVYPEIMIGNSMNNGKPLRQESNYCYTDQDCQGIDKFTGKNKVGMSCNHFYKGPSIFEKNGMCQVQYEDKGRRYFLKTPPGWVWPLNQKIKECNTQSDCGVTGINGWTRCVGGANDGKKYCVWPGQTYTPNPREMTGTLPRNIRPEPAPTFKTPSGIQGQVLNVQAEMANQTGLETPGGSLRNVSGPPTPPNMLVAGSGSGAPKVPEAANISSFKSF